MRVVRRPDLHAAGVVVHHRGIARTPLVGSQPEAPEELWNAGAIDHRAFGHVQSYVVRISASQFLLEHHLSTVRAPFGMDEPAEFSVRVLGHSSPPNRLKLLVLGGSGAPAKPACLW